MNKKELVRNNIKNKIKELITIEPSYTDEDKILVYDGFKKRGADNNTVKEVLAEVLKEAGGEDIKKEETESRKLARRVAKQKDEDMSRYMTGEDTFFDETIPKIMLMIDELSSILEENGFIDAGGVDILYTELNEKLKEVTTLMIKEYE